MIAGLIIGIALSAAAVGAWAENGDVDELSWDDYWRWV